MGVISINLVKNRKTNFNIPLNKKCFHIILSLLLTVAVSDYVWIELFEDERIVAELEIEKEKELEEEFKEKDSSHIKHTFIDANWFIASNSSSIQIPSISSFFKHGNSFCPLVSNTSPKLFILFSQLRLHC